MSDLFADSYRKAVEEAEYLNIKRDEGGVSYDDLDAVVNKVEDFGFTIDVEHGRFTVRPLPETWDDDE